MGYVLYVGFAIHRRATVRIHLYFKRLMFKQMICIKKKKKKKNKKKKSSKKNDFLFLKNIFKLKIVLLLKGRVSDEGD
jgi:hypothetical protein